MPTERKLQLTDVLILVAATGVGLAWVRYNESNVLSHAIAEKIYDPTADTYPIPRSWREIWHYVSLSWVWIEAMLPLVAVTSVVMVLLQLRGSRQNLRRLARQPGFVACASASLALAAGAVGNAITLHVDDAFFRIENPGRPDPYPEHYFPNLSRFIDQKYVGIAVAGAWLVLLLGGRRRRVNNWIEASARLLGLFWVLMVPISWFWRWLCRFA
jgi:hypothetical protein